MGIRRLFWIAVFGMIAFGPGVVNAVAGEAPARVSVSGGAYTNVTAALL